MYFYNNEYSRMKAFKESNGSAQYMPPRSQVIKNKRKAKKKGKKK